MAMTRRGLFGRLLAGYALMRVKPPAPVKERIIPSTLPVLEPLLGLPQQPPGVVSRRLYRAYPDGSYKFICKLDNNAQFSYTDNDHP